MQSDNLFLSTQSDENSYDQVPYESGCFPQTAPDRMRTVGVLLGMAPPAVESARVLEIGCGNGGNLLPLAYAWPKSRFTGIDLSEQAIRRAAERGESLRLKNIEFVQKDICAVNEDFGRFDFIICHGIYSWVPDRVKHGILKICRENLAQNGIAYVSYNCFPGWHQRLLARELMQFHTGNQGSARFVISQSRAILDYIADLVPESNTLYRNILRNEQACIQGCLDWHLFHDYLEESNDPIYFSEFVRRASEFDLQYLGDAEASKMVAQDLPPRAQEMLAKLSSDIIRFEQYLDFVRGRMFRRTLLCRNDVVLKREFRPSDVEQFSIASMMMMERDAAGREFFRHPNGGALNTRESIMLDTARHLSRIWPRGATLPELMELTRKSLDRSIAGEHAEELHRQALTSGILRCYLADLMELRSVEPSLNTSLRASEMARQSSVDYVTNLLHLPIGLPAEIKQFLPLFDGTRHEGDVRRSLGSNFERVTGWLCRSGLMH